MDKNIHQTILQTLFTRPYINRRELEGMLVPFNIDFQKFVSKSNEMLSSIGFELRNIKSDFDDNEYFGICLTQEDSNASEGIGIKASVVHFFFKFIDLYIENLKENNTSTVDKAYIIQNMEESIMHNDFNDMLTQLDNLGYLHVKGNRIRIGQRGLLEFRPFFMKLASNDQLQTCSICLDFLLQGYKCSKCNTYFHKRCKESLEQNSNVCPVCGTTDKPVEYGVDT